MSVRPEARSPRTLPTAVLTALALLGLAGSARADERVAVIPYQGAGRDPELVAALAAALDATLVERGWTLADAGETKRQERAGAMCGEDAACLATIGQRLEARWVLAFGVGRVAGKTMVSSLLVDAAEAVRRTTFTETLASVPGVTPAALAPLAGRIGDALLLGLVAPSRLTPLPPKEPPTSLVAPLPASRPLKPWALGTALGAGALAVAGATVSVGAAVGFSRLPEVPPSQRPTADAQQRSLNLSADLLVGAAIVAGAAAVVLFILDGRAAPGAAATSAPEGGRAP